jgi:glyoxylase-like metal-dependent hydrolase (beta-lactamase superfamily II)
VGAKMRLRSRREFVLSAAVAGAWLGLDKSIFFVKAPGHTPGHTAFHLSSDMRS